jgi:SAM-dependent methyltransferase
MGLGGPEFYDDDAVFATYKKRRGRPDAPNETMEGPEVADLVGDVTGLRVLDLGCGDGAYGKALLARGARSYLGVEGSRNMAEAARSTLLATPGAKVMHATLEGWDYPAGAFDLMVSRLVFHYIADLGALLGKVHRALAPGGRLVFSVEHPVITSCDLAYQGAGPRQDWVVDDYFIAGARQTIWMGGQVIKYHRTVADHFAAMQAAGFTVTALREGAPRAENFPAEADFRRRQRIPLFLLMAGRR